MNGVNLDEKVTVSLTEEDYFSKKEKNQLIYNLTVRKMFFDEPQGEWDVIRILTDAEGIKCDTPHCNWRDDDADAGDTRWLNRPCPMCGGNLLTKKDLLVYSKQFVNFLKINRFANKWGPRFPRLVSLFYKKHPVEKVFTMNGTGKIKMVDAEKTDV